MKHLNTLTCVVFILFCNSVVYSQEITTGIYSGVNFSDIHGQDIGGKWSPKPGPVIGFNLEYSFNKSIGVETGIGFSSVYYEHKTYSSIYYPYPSYSSIAPVFLYSANGAMNFSFLRVPLLLTVSIPSSVQLNMRAGLFYTSLRNYTLNTLYYYPGYPDKPPKNDFGYMFSSGISFPLSDKFKARIDVSYLTGRKKIIDYSNYRHGSSEITLGIAYTGSLANKNNGSALKMESDSSTHRVAVTLFGGMNYSWNKGSKDYSGYAGPAFGFSLDFPLGKGTIFQSGLSFEKKGYSMKDSSSSFYRFVHNDNILYYVDSKIQIDYAIIPALLKFQFGESGRVFFKTGPWLGFRLNARTEGTAYNEYHSETSYLLRKTIVYDDIEKSVKGYDIGWIFGCGMSIPIIEGYEADLKLQYSTSFRDVYGNSPLVAPNNPYDPLLKIRNRTISLTLGFRIPYQIN